MNATMEALTHYTLNTGHSRQSPRSEVTDGAIADVRPMLADGVHVLVFAGYTVRTTAGQCSLLATLHDAGGPLVSFAVADTEDGADEVWPHLERLYLDLTDRPPFSRANWQPPRRPQSLPWLACVIVGAPMPSWAADLERSMAWAWLESRT